jgi:hypothetical protein
MIYGADNSEAIDSTGLFLDNTAAFRGDDNDVNDADHFGSPNIREDGAGVRTCALSPNRHSICCPCKSRKAGGRASN